MNKLETKYEQDAMQIALEWHLAEMPDDMTSTAIFDDLANLLETCEYCYAWEPLEDWSADALSDSIWNLKASVLAMMVRCHCE
ncbi:hypothetical protein UFOVP923_28 [uncultured Caudovirales phage]|uniref:Uncharacterized protein n=1 Tax=uncultured Caudovirales phage TaxID=2100421 RepID=A0A6J5PIT2_9CAUD|nr:hypothetical protein UFOVP923_28 [uncultured Caudovirales phage]